MPPVGPANLAVPHLPRFERIPGWAAVFAATAAAGLALQVTLVDRFLFILCGLPGLRSFMAWSITKRYNRYAAPGFMPAAGLRGTPGANAETSEAE